MADQSEFDNAKENTEESGEYEMAKKPRLSEPVQEKSFKQDEIEQQTTKETTNEQMKALLYESSSSSSTSSGSGTDIDSLSEMSDEDESDITVVEGNLITSKLRKFQKLPVYITEYHNDVLEFIFRCIRSRFLPCEDNTLIHFDSHPDMVIPRELSAEMANKSEAMLEACSIESWIMPLCYTGIIKRIVWIKHPSCQQIPLGKHNFHIGSFNNEIYVDLAIPYFLSEASLCASSQMENKRAIELLVVNDYELAEEDVATTAISDWLSKGDENYILDIDLDFFCTKNPFLNLYNLCKDYYSVLAQIFALDNVKQLNEEHINVMNERRFKTLKALQKIFLHLKENNADLSGYQHDADDLDSDKFVLLQKLVAELLEHYAPSEIDWLQIYDAGCTADSGGLPHFELTGTELAAAGKRFRQHLEKLPHEPLLVTISRSSEDEFCPAAQVEEVQAMTLRELGAVWTLHKPILEYKDEYYNILKM